MRSDFTDARRYAPSILFIDEIDCIGNRERLVGHNASHQTDVVNVLGAARRARRESRPIEQEDLLAEVTGRPRRADSAPQLGPDEMRRVAESGVSSSTRPPA